MDWLLVLGLAVLAMLAAVVYVHILMGTTFSNIANAKGYEKDIWKVACIILGLPAWLLVIALPNKKYHEELLAELQNRQNIE